MNYEQIQAIDNLDVYVRTPGCWRATAAADLVCNAMQGMEVKLHNGAADGAVAEVWIYAHGGSRDDAYIQTTHTFVFSESCLLDYSATVRRMAEKGVTDAVMDIDYTDAGSNTTNGKVFFSIRKGRWGVVSPIVMPSAFRVVAGTVWRLSLANRTSAAQTFRRWRGGSVAESVTVPAQESLGVTVADGGADTIEFGGIKVPVVEVHCGAVMLTWASKEDGVDKSYAFNVAGDTVARDATAGVSVDGLAEWWQTGGIRMRLMLPVCDWVTYMYLRDLIISDDVRMTVYGYDTGGHLATTFAGVRVSSAFGGVPVHGTADLEFEIEAWKEVTEWAR